MNLLTIAFMYFTLLVGSTNMYYNNNKKNNMFYSFCFNPLKLLHLSFRKPADLQNLAPGTHPPFITFNGEVKTDVNKIEEFLEDILCPPK